MSPDPASASGVDLFWLPLGAGDTTHLVRTSGRLYEALVAAAQRRERRPLFHSALELRVDGDRSVVEMAPVWRAGTPRGVVGEGPVGLRLLGRSRLFRYEVRCWAGGELPDRAEAVDSPVRVSADRDRAARVVELTREFPLLVWGRDELGTGDMWNSNSLVSWLLARSGHEVAGLAPPRGGRAPGWAAGLAAAAQ